MEEAGNALPCPSCGRTIRGTDVFPEPITRGTRMMSIFVDSALFFPGVVLMVLLSPTCAPMDFGHLGILLAPAMAVCVCKDGFGGRSPAKRMLNLRLSTTTEGERHLPSKHVSGISFASYGRSRSLLL